MSKDLKFTPWVLTVDGCKNVHKYTYSCVDLSIIAKYVMQPVWAKMLHFIPEWMAPNLVTLIGFFFVLLSYFVTTAYSPTLSEPLPGWVYLLNFVCLFLYQSFDALDGKQARRTQSSSALGELFDHGCDAMTSIFSTLTVFATLRAGTGFGSYVNLLCLMFAFFTAQWEVYFTSTLNLWYINVTEAQFLGMTIHLLAFIFGADFWLIPFTIDETTLSLGGWLIPSSGLFSLVTGLSSIVNVLRTSKTRFNEAIVNLLPALYIVVLFTLWTLIYPNMFVSLPHLPSIVMGFLFANIITKLTTSRVCKEVWKIQDQWLLVPLPFCVLNSLLNRFAIGILSDDLAIQILAVISVASYLVFAIGVIHDITHSLDIFALKLKPKTN